MKSAAIIIAETFGIDVEDVKESRYQSTQTTKPIYAIDNFYYTTGKKEPKDQVGQEWEMHHDQFFAEKNGTVLWVAEAL